MPPSPRKQRDPLLDLWRGLALVDMAWVHLAAYPIGMAAVLALWIGDYTRFAAGTFVLISGLSVARVFGPRLVGDAARVQETHRRLLRRALLLLVLDRLICVAFGLVETSLSVPPTVTPRYPDLVDLLTFTEPGVTGGLLSLYAVLVAATPPLDWTLRRFGALRVLALSAGIFGLAHAGAFGVASGNWPFPVVYWQPLFVAGYVASHRLDVLRAPSGRIAGWWRALVSLVFGVVFLLRNGAALELSIASALPTLAFVKVPLSAAELGWYLTVSAFVLTWMAWIWESSQGVRGLVGWLTLLGRQSLLVYVAHLFVQLALIEILTLLDPSSAARALMLPLMALILVGVATAGERWGRAPRSAPSTGVGLARLLPTPAFIGGSVMAGTLGVVLVLQLLLGTPASWELSPSPEGGLQAVSGMEEGADFAGLGEEMPDPLRLPWLLGPEIEGYPASPLVPPLLDLEGLVSET